MWPSVGNGWVGQLSWLEASKVGLGIEVFMLAATVVTREVAKVEFTGRIGLFYFFFEIQEVVWFGFVFNSIKALFP